MFKNGQFYLTRITLLENLLDIYVYISKLFKNKIILMFILQPKMIVIIT